MATDKITVELMLATKQAERAIAQINRKLGDLGKAAGKSFGGMGGGTDKVRALGTGLSKATVKADEFSKSLEASNARVIAFGASAGIIMGVDRALKAMVASAIKVEKAMMDVSVVMQVSTRQLDQFGKGMFRVAKETAQGFDIVAEAATELARQGLGMEKTLSRTKDALILTRLTGMSAADSVKSLTAAVNSFNKEGITSSQIVNRMAKVDAAYAVSSEDLAKSISRVGASAISAGVGLNELMAITTAVQQKTARGGAVIGNAFKTIFTRIQRSDVQKKLRDMGISATDNFGRMKSGMVVLQNMADGFDKLTKTQQASLAENVAGVFQVNILKAALSDLSAATSHYKGALDSANSATNEAYQRNEQLNQTLDALGNRTLANLTKAGSSIGGATLEPAIRKVLNSVNTVIDAFSEGGRFENFGSTMGKGLVDGIGNFIKGPGLIIVGTAFMKLGLSLAKFAGAAFKDLMGLNAATKQRAALEEAVIAHIASEPALLAKVRTGTLNVLSVEKDILATVVAANAERARIQTYAAPLATSLVARGMRAGPKGATVPGRAAGFVPNFASPGGERAAAAAGGYRAGSIKTMNQPGAGTMMYNSAETVKKFPGMSQSAIMPPQSSPAGAGYKSAFGAAHGFDPYAGRGFVPNFGRPSGPVSPFTSAPGATKKSQRLANQHVYSVPAEDIGVLLGYGDFQGVARKDFGAKASGLLGLKKWPALYKQLSEEGASVKLQRVRVKSFISGSTAEVAETEFADEIRRNIKGGLSSLASVMMGQLGIEGRPGKAGTIGPAFQGEVFEESMRMAMKAAEALPGAAFDFEANGPPSLTMSKIFGRPISRIDAKRRMESAAGAQHGIPKKYFNDIGTAPDGVAEIVAQRAAMLKEAKIYNRPMTSKGEYSDPFKKMLSKGKVPGSASGFVPNFSPLTSAISREMQAGVPASAIRVGSSSALKSAGNPGGVGVYNTIHEPGGLNQGISRSRAQGVNPKSHGVPNFVTYSDPKVLGGVPLTSEGKIIIDTSGLERNAKLDAKSSETTAKSAGRMEKASNGILMASMMLSMAAPGVASAIGARPSTQGGVSAGANILAMAGMGVAMTAGTGPGMILGGLAGAGVGALTSMGDLQMGFGEEGRVADAKAIQDMAKSVSEGLDQVKKALSGMADFDYMTTGQRIDAISKVSEKYISVRKKLNEGGESMASAREAFYGSRAIQSIQSGKFINSSPDDIKAAEEALSQIDRQTEAVITSGSPAFFRKNMEGVLESTMLMRRYEQYEAKPPIGWDADEARLAFEGEEIKQQNRVQGSFTPSVQEAMATAKGVGVMVKGQGYLKKSGQEILSAYAAEMDKDTPDVKKALSGGMIPLLRASGQENMAASLETMLGPKAMHTAPGSGFGKERALTPEELNALGQPGKIAGGYPYQGPVGRKYSRSYGGSGVVRLLEDARERNELSMFMPGVYGPQKEKDVDPLANQKAKDRQRTIMELYAGRDASRAGGRAAGFTLAAGVGGRRRGVDLRSQGRTQGAQLSAAQGMFGNRLFDKMEGLKLEGAFDTYSTSMADITAAEKATVGKTEGTAGDVYLKALQEGKMKASMRKAAGGKLGDYRGMTLKQKEDERTALRGTETFEETAVGAAKIKYLTSVIEAEVKAREVSVHKQGEAALNFQNNSKKVLANTKHLKAMEEASKHFYSADYINNLKKERSVLAGKIHFQKEEVAAGRLNVEVLHESKMKFEGLNDAIDGTGKQLEVLGQRFKQILTGVLSDKEIKDATVEAKGKLASQIKTRQLGGAGAAGTAADAQAAFAANQITSSELRTIKANARLNAPGATGNPMEAFRDQFLYNGRDAMLDFESGVIGVADTMKSSFADAFKNIASGASSAQDAIAQFAGNILNAISDMSAQMATKMLFSRMGMSEGGQLPRYGGGGIVTGGSGTKDDVLSMMNAGEYVIKKSSAKKIGYDTLNAINSGGVGGFAEGGAPAGGGGMGKMFAVSAAASAASGLISGQWGKSKKKPWRGQDYGKGRGEYGYFGGPDSDAGGQDSIAGGGRGAQVSLNKAYVYYRRDPETGKLVSERARPTEGKYEVSGALSLLGRLNADDRQTGRMFDKEKKMGSYSDYLFGETERRKEVIRAHKKQKKGRLIGAYMNAAMMIGGSYMMGKTGPMTSDLTGASVSGQGRQGFNALSASQRGGMSAKQWLDAGVNINDSGYPDMATGGSAKGTSPAMLTGGEFVMGADTVRQYGLDFMGELNRGGVPGMAAGGPVSRGNQGAIAGMVAGGETNNNVNISINVDKRGNVEAKATQDPTESDNASKENSSKDIENNKDLGKALQSVVLQELIRQQRPGGLLQSRR